MFLSVVVLIKDVLNQCLLGLRFLNPSAQLWLSSSKTQSQSLSGSTKQMILLCLMRFTNKLLIVVNPEKKNDDRGSIFTCAFT